MQTVFTRALNAPLPSLGFAADYLISALGRALRSVQTKQVAALIVAAILTSGNCIPCLFAGPAAEPSKPVVAVQHGSACETPVSSESDTRLMPGVTGIPSSGCAMAQGGAHTDVVISTITPEGGAGFRLFPFPLLSTLSPAATFSELVSTALAFAPPDFFPSPASVLTGTVVKRE